MPLPEPEITPAPESEADDAEGFATTIARPREEAAEPEIRVPFPPLPWAALATSWPPPAARSWHLSGCGPKWPTTLPAVPPAPRPSHACPQARQCGSSTCSPAPAGCSGA